jgi:hypothetical protein
MRSIGTIPPRERLVTPIDALTRVLPSAAGPMSERTSRSRSSVDDAEPSEDPDAGDGFQGVAEGDSESDRDGRAGPGVDHERAERHARPEAVTEEKERCEGEAGRRPDERRKPADRVHREAEPGDDEVGGGENERAQQVAHAIVSPRPEPGCGRVPAGGLWTDLRCDERAQ